jgi:hypothetical protein
MQNFIWMEVKTANGVKDRTTSRGIVTFALPPEPCSPACPYSDLATGYPYIRFQDSALETDPSKVTIDSMIEMRGADPTGAGSMVNCGTPAAPIMRFCPAGPITATKAVRDIITDSAFMSYTIADTSTVTAFPPPGSQFDNYHRMLETFGIWVHSKHSEFFGIKSTVPATFQNTFVLGSSNIDTRSLGSTSTQQDDEDSQLDVFWTPSDLDFNKQLWTEHMGVAAGYPNSIQDWKDQGWANWNNFRARQPNSGRVIRLDAVERCIRLGGC